MMEYLFLNSYLKFDPVSQITNVFYDDTRQQIFIVKASAVSVKSSDDSQSFSFLMENAPLIAIKFNSNNSALAIQRTENSLEIHAFSNNQLVANQVIHYESKKTILYGFFWTLCNELVVVGADHIEIFQVNTAKKCMKSLKSLCVSSNWFAWNRSNLTVLSSNNGLVLTPILLMKPGTLTKLVSIQIEEEPGVSERDVYTGILYGTPAILILRTTRNRNLEVWVYLLDGPQFLKRHILKLGFSGRVAVSIIDSVIIVHHQTLKISLIFDIAGGEPDPQNKSVMLHSSLVPGKSIKSFAMKMPSVSVVESSVNVELYSTNWVIFQPDVIIDVKLGYLFKLSLAIEKVQIFDKVRLVDFLMHRESGKSQLLSVLLQVISPVEDSDSEAVHLPVLETIFDKINNVYKQKLDHDLVKIQALPSPSGFKSFSTPVVTLSAVAPNQVVIEQSDILLLLNTIIDKSLLEKVLMIYVYSIVKHSISCEYDMSKLLILTLVGSQKIQDLQQILSYNVLHESKPLACFLLSLTNRDPLISQMAFDMLKRLNSHEIIVEILLEQGKVIDAIRLTKQSSSTDFIVARKFLDAAQKSGDKMIFFTVYNFLVARNQRLRGNGDFSKSEQCDGFTKSFNEMFPPKQ